MEKEYLDLTDPQQSIWIIEQYYPNTSINNISGSLIIEQKVNFELLKKAIYIFVQKNDSFRTRITIRNKEPKQYTLETLKFDIDEKNLMNAEDLKDLENSLVSTPFKLLNSDLFKFTIIKFKDGTGGFNAKVHHIISDAWTMSLLINEIIDIYTALINNENISNELYPSYSQYVISNKEYKESEKYLKDKEYWQNTFAVMPEVPYISNYNNEKNNLEAKRDEYVFEKEFLDKINLLCKRKKISLYSFLMGVYSIYLSRVSGIDNPIIGTPILNRKNFREKNTTGMFINNIPNKIAIDRKLSFNDFVIEVSKTQREVFKHQQLGYEEILKEVRKKYQTTEALYDIVLSYQNARDNSRQSKIPYHTNWIFNNFSLNSIWVNIYDMDNTETLKIIYDYQTCKFSKSDINKIHNRILHIIEQIINNEDIILNNIEIVTAEEKNKLLYDFNDTKMEYPKGKTIHKLFEEQVERTPDKIAIVFEETQLTYSELNKRANQLANYLRDNKKIINNDIVGIMVNRSIEMIIGLLAIIKAGGAYLPIDPDYPKDRISYMLEDSKTKTVLVNNSTENIVINNSDKINISLNSEIYLKESFNNLDNINISDDLIYVIYTSGSTGKPKGVMLTHKNINNYINGLKRCIDFADTKTIVSVTTICFDIFVTEIWASLLNGLKVVLANEEEQNIPKKLNEICKNHHVDMIQTTPSRYNIILSSGDCDFLENVKDVLIGGEPLNQTLLSKIKAITKANIYNMYGPTETAVWSTIKDLTKTDEITIGKPIINTQIYILDKNKNLLPPNISGELYIGGDGVAKGYLNREELTKEKFVKVPFNLGKIYNTNDLAYIKEDGEIIYLGRTDFQVKINGHRVELEEIENSILKLSSISSCTVIVKKDGTEKDCIYAYFVAKEKIDVNILRKNLQQKLPQYMVPQYFMQLENLPYTPNGKIDKKRLPDINIENRTIIKQAETPIEKTLEKILKGILNIKDIDFSENLLTLGGDSLTAITLSVEISKKFDIDITIKELMEVKSLEELAKIITNKPKNNNEENIINAVTKKDYYCTSYAQKRIYLASQMSSNVVYNMPGKVCIEGKLNIKKLENALKTLIDRHEALRTYFEILKNGEIVQKLEENIKFKLEIQKCNKNNLENKIKEFVQPFDLSKAPLFRAKVLQLQTEKFVLLFDMHHIISDGTSIKIIIKELQDIYNDKELQEINITYKDYANWEKEKIEEGNFKSQEEFWLNQFNDEIPILNMPLDYKRPEINLYNGNSISEKININLSNNIIDLAKKFNTTPYVLLLSIYYLVLSKYTNQNDIVIATPTINRTIKGLDSIVGMFVNNIPIRIKSDNNKKFSELIENVKNISLKCFDNQNYPIDKLIQKQDLDNGKNSLFNTMFVYQNNENLSIQLDDLKTKTSIINTNISKFDLTLEIIETNNEFDVRIEYNTDLYKKETIELLKEHYINVLEEIIRKPSIQLADVEMMSNEEKNTILYNFNNTKFQLDNSKSIQEIFEENVKRNPNAIALIFEDKKIKYSELNKKANILAVYLKNNGVKRNSIVGISTKRSTELIVSLLAILKAGGAYLPIDPTLPLDRKEYMLETSGCKILLVDNDSKINYKVKTINVQEKKLYEGDFENIANINNEDDLFAVIYTSGSTGKPKCVTLMRKRTK